MAYSITFEKKRILHDLTLLNLLKDLVKSNKMGGLPTILLLFCIKFEKKQKYKSTNIGFYLSYDNKITLKSHFWRKNVSMARHFIHVTLP